MIPLLTKCKYNDPPPPRGNHKKFNLTPLPYTHTHILHYIVKMHYFFSYSGILDCMFIPTLFKKSDEDIAVAFVSPSVRPSTYMYSLLNHWTKSNQNWCVCVCMCVCVCVCVAHIYGVCNGTFILAPPPGALGSGQTVEYYQISLKFSYKVNFKDF